MVVFLNVFLKFFAEEVTDGGHKRLKAAEPRAYQNIVFGAQFLHGKAFTYRNGESVHRKPDSYHYKIDNIHKNLLSLIYVKNTLFPVGLDADKSLIRFCRQRMP